MTQIPGLLTPSGFAGGVSTAPHSAAADSSIQAKTHLSVYEADVDQDLATQHVLRTAIAACKHACLPLPYVLTCSRGHPVLITNTWS